MQNTEKDFYTCSICLEYFTEPKCLPCLHNFCKSCLVPLLLRSPRLICPLCQAITEFDQKKGVESFKTNFYIKNLMASLDKNLNTLPVKNIEAWTCQELEAGTCTSCEDIEQPAIGKCEDCSEFLCQFCESAHRRLKLTRTHSITMFAPVSDKKRASMENVVTVKTETCKSHIGQTVVSACIDCCQIFCSYCLMGEESSEHQHHTVLGVREATEYCFRQFPNSKAKYHTALAEMDTICDDMIRHKCELLASKTVVMQRCKKEYEELLNRFVAKRLPEFEAVINDRITTETTRVSEMRTKADAIVISLTQNEKWFSPNEEDPLFHLMYACRQQLRILKEFQELKKPFYKHCLVFKQDIDFLLEKTKRNLSDCLDALSINKV